MPVLEAFVQGSKTHGSLTIFPLVASRNPSLNYLLSSQIQGRDILTIRQQGPASSPMLLARNGSFHSLLLLSGDTLPRGDPDRCLLRSFLLGGNSVIQIPTSAVEPADLSDTYEEEAVTQSLELLAPEEGQIGFLAFVGNAIEGIEALGSPNLYRQAYRLLLAPYVKQAFSMSTHLHDAGDGLDPGDDLETMRAKAEAFVEALADADRQAVTGVGLGVYSAFSGRLSGGELLHQGNLVHLAARPARNGAWVGRERAG